MSNSSNNEQYLNDILIKYQLKNSHHSKLQTYFEPIISNWAKDNLQEFCVSGSIIKGTAIKTSSDIDFFVSIKSTAEYTIKEIYDSLFLYLDSYSYLNIKKQNVSIGVTIKSYKLDITPGKNDKGNTNNHKIYSNKNANWILTNIKKQSKFVADSDRKNEIILLKIWRDNHKLCWPSVYLELFVIETLKNKSKYNLVDNFLYLLDIITEDIDKLRIVDPTNSNNTISNDLTFFEKLEIKLKAINSIKQDNFEEILW